MPTLYAPGTTPIAVTPRGFAVLEPGTSAPLLGRIRTLVADGRGLGGVIEALTGAYGASLTAIPAFAVALPEGDGIRIAVRGDFAFEVDAATPERVTGTGVTTWTERVIPAVVRVALTTSEPDASSPAEWEITDGVVLAGGIVWDAAAPRPSAAPALAKRPEPASAQVAAPEPEPAAAAEDAAEVPSKVPAEATGAEATAAAPEIPRAAASPPPAIAVPAGGLIDSVPSLADAETLLPSDSALSPDDVAPARSGLDAWLMDEDDEDAAAGAAGFDELIGATVIRSADDAEPQEAPAPAPAPGPAVAGDHDGATISLVQARALRAAASGAEGANPAPSPAEAPLDPLAPPRPPAPGRVRMSTGQVIPLDRTVVIGRRPRSTRVSGTDLPHLVAVDSPQQDISRSHVELRAEGESIVATDLRTTNGTTLLRPGTDPVRLHPGEGTVVVPGDVLDLGDGITVAIEGMS
ncbi:FHA domain-containing protein [Microbacterium sp. QXD-8]|uniref:FHA domain-containing protein n=1 Tax=Microbacterium psychrotolerans TaxID=3068321 RepID=A0ABU0YWK0_9MICO|nr:FHA domain-containing protein [Microbacterium sp. QXD-8]MDQ7876702.1 FHA domain-containing protein [Microbacterium sp. QXD-8]